MEDKIEMCHRCTSNASYYIKNENPPFEMYFCYGCGFNALVEPKPYEEGLPELYKVLKYIDKETDLTYYPSSVNISNKGMVFADGDSINNWKWAAICAVKIPKKELKKFPEGQTHKMDMSTIQHFDERDFMDALGYIGYFESQNS